MLDLLDDKFSVKLSALVPSTALADVKPVSVAYAETHPSDSSQK